MHACMYVCRCVYLVCTCTVVTVSQQWTASCLLLIAKDMASPRLCYRTTTLGYPSFGPIKNINVFCDVSVREKDWRSRARGAQAT